MPDFFSSINSAIVKMIKRFCEIYENGLILARVYKPWEIFIIYSFKN
jgi:hypothetical protein